MSSSTNSFRQTSIFNVRRNKNEASKVVNVNEFQEAFHTRKPPEIQTSKSCFAFFKYFKKFLFFFGNNKNPEYSNNNGSVQEVTAKKAIKKAAEVIKNKLKSSKLPSVLPSVTIQEANSDIGVNFSELKITLKKDGILELLLYVKENRQTKAVAYKLLCFGTPDDMRKYLYNKGKLDIIYKEIQELSKLLKRNK